MPVKSKLTRFSRFHDSSVKILRQSDQHFDRFVPLRVVDVLINSFDSITSFAADLIKIHSGRQLGDGEQMILNINLPARPEKQAPPRQCANRPTKPKWPILSRIKWKYRRFCADRRTEPFRKYSLDEAAIGRLFRSQIKKLLEKVLPTGEIPPTGEFLCFTRLQRLS